MSGMTAANDSQDQGDHLSNVMARALSDPTIDVAKMREIYAIYAGMQRDRARGAFLRAMSRVQIELEPVVRNAHNDYLGNYHSTLDAIVEAARPIYTRNGFSLRFRTTDPVRPGNVRMICVTSYAPDDLPVPYEEESPLEAPPDMDGSQGRRNKTPIQGVASTTTQLRKLLTCLAFNIVLEYKPPKEDAPARRRKAEPTDEEAAAELPEQLGAKKVWRWLEEFDARLGTATTREEFDDILTDAGVRKISTWLADEPAQKSAYGRFKVISDDAARRIERLRSAQRTPQAAPSDLFRDGSLVAAAAP